MDKEINEMAKSYCKQSWDCSVCTHNTTCTYKNVAKSFIEAGYRKADEVRREYEQEIADLKQELKIAQDTKERLTFADRLRIAEIAIKDTAKEILDEVWALVNRKDTVNLSTRIKEIAERNGVEVDE